MMSQHEFCEKLAAAPSAAAEAKVLQAREDLPPPARAIRYAIRRLSDGATLGGDQFTPAMLGEVEVVLYCKSGDTEQEVVWKPKAIENLQILLRE